MHDTDTQIRFDTVKFVSSAKHIYGIDNALFKSEIDMETGAVLSIAFLSHQHPVIIPSKLYIGVDYRTGRMTIEFSSKILREDYPRLISATTFSQCLRNIEALGICSLDIDGIVRDCYFNKVHITRDINLQLTPEILDRLNRCTGNYRRYTWNRYNEGVTFTKNVKAVDCRETITIYDKGVEIGLPKNSLFLVATGCADEIRDHFTGKTRLEVKLANKRKIQKELGIADTDFTSVMGCGRNIVLAQFDKIFGSSAPVSEGLKIGNLVDFGLWGLIRYHNGDLQRIEQEMKDLHLYGEKSRGAMSRQMRKIRAMTEAYLSPDTTTDPIIDNIRKLLIQN